MKPRCLEAHLRWYRDTSNRGDARPDLEIDRFCLERGEIVALIGESGAGKSTLLYALAGALPHFRRKNGDSGFVSLDQATWRPGLVSPLACTAREEMVLCLQDASKSLDYRLDIGSQLECVKRLARRCGTDIWLNSSEFMSSFGFEADSIFRRHANELSGGMKQISYLMLALSRRMCFYLLDEPSASLDPLRVRTLANWLRKLKGYGAGVLVVTHDLNFAARVADRGLSMHDGRIVEAFSPVSTCAIRHDRTLELFEAHELAVADASQNADLAGHCNENKV